MERPWFKEVYTPDALGTSHTVVVVNVVLATASAIVNCVCAFFPNDAYASASVGLVFGLSWAEFTVWIEEEDEEAPKHVYTRWPLLSALALTSAVETWIPSRDTWYRLNYVVLGLVGVQWVALLTWTAYRGKTDAVAKRRRRGDCLRWSFPCGLVDWEGKVIYLVELVVAAFDLAGSRGLGFGFNTGPASAIITFMALVFYGRAAPYVTFRRVQTEPAAYFVAWFTVVVVTTLCGAYVTVVQAWYQAALLWSLLGFLVVHAAFASLQRCCDGGAVRAP